MTTQCPLIQLCSQRLGQDDERSQDVAATLTALEEGRTLNSVQLDSLNDSSSHTPWDLVRLGESILCAALVHRLASEQGNKDPFPFADEIVALERTSSWPQLPLLEAIVDGSRTLLGENPRHYPESRRSCVPFVRGHFWDWADVPFLAENAELGLIHAMVALLTQHSHYAESAVAIAEWQQKLLDADNTPTNLYLREGTSSSTTLLALHYLLYRAVAQLRQCPRSAAISQRLLQQLHQVPLASPLPPYLLAVEAFLARQHPMPRIEEAELPEVVSDTEAFIAGFRTKEKSIFCSLTGSRTGLGCMRKGDASIVSFGPQGLPLGDCRQFGIESPLGSKRGALKMQGASFKLFNTVRLPLDLPSNEHPATYGVAPAPHHYADLQQEYTDDLFQIWFQPYSFDHKQELAFSFFAKASNCLLCNGTLIKRRSLDRYEGRSIPLTLQGSQGTLTLLPGDNEGSMQIIPLAGGEVFWGADYLISFKTPPTGKAYQWKISF